MHPAIQLNTNRDYSQGVADYRDAGVVKLVDARVSKTCSARSGGSIPTTRTKASETART